MDCSECTNNIICEKPYDCDEKYQLQYLGRIYTKKEWQNEGVCIYFNKNLFELSKESEK